MVFRPVIHLIVLVVIALVAATFVFLSARRSLRTNLMDVIRRSLIAVVVIIMGAGPSIPGTIIEVTSNIEVYFVIDRTGSMGAEDWDGENPPYRRRSQRCCHTHGCPHGSALLDSVVGFERAHGHAVDD